MISSLILASPTPTCLVLIPNIAFENTATVIMSYYSVATVSIRRKIMMLLLFLFSSSQLLFKQSLNKLLLILSMLTVHFIVKPALQLS